MDKLRYLLAVSVITTILVVFINNQSVKAQTGAPFFKQLRPGTYVGKISFDVVETDSMNQQGVTDNTVVSFSQDEGNIIIYVNNLRELNVFTDLNAIHGFYLRDVSAPNLQQHWYADSTYYVAKNNAFDVWHDERNGDQEGYSLNQSFVLPISITQKTVWQNKYTCTGICGAVSESTEEANLATWIKGKSVWFPEIELNPTEGSDLYISGTCDFHTPHNPTGQWNKQAVLNGVSYKSSTKNCHWGALEEHVRNRLMAGM